MQPATIKVLMVPDQLYYYIVPDSFIASKYYFLMFRHYHPFSTNIDIPNAVLASCSFIWSEHLGQIFYCRTTGWLQRGRRPFELFLVSVQHNNPTYPAHLPTSRSFVNFFLDLFSVLLNYVILSASTIITFRAFRTLTIHHIVFPLCVRVGYFANQLHSMILPFKNMVSLNTA